MQKKLKHIEMKTVFPTNGNVMIKWAVLLLNVFAKHILEYNKLSKIFCGRLDDIHCKIVVSFEKNKLEILQVRFGIR